MPIMVALMWNKVGLGLGWRYFWQDWHWVCCMYLYVTGQQEAKCCPLLAAMDWPTYAVTHSYVTVAVTHSYVTVAVTHSYVTVAVTHSYVTVAVTHSYVTVAVTHSYVTVAVTHSYVTVAVTHSYVTVAVHQHKVTVHFFFNTWQMIVETFVCVPCKRVRVRHGRTVGAG